MRRALRCSSSPPPPCSRRGGRAEAHPLGNFSVNHLAVVSIDRGAVDVRWILEQAEIPTFRSAALRRFRCSPESARPRSRG